MISTAEIRPFVFGVTFIVIFAALLNTIPVGLQGQGDTADNITPLDPDLVAGYAETTNWTKASYSLNGLFYDYSYDAFNGKDWIARYSAGSPHFYLGSKALLAGFLWLGTLDYVQFINDDGENYGIYFTLSDLDNDHVDGTVKYSMIYEVNGNSAGDLLIWFNATLYSTASNAWGNNSMYFAHGVGFDDNAGQNIAILLVQLLTLQLPDTPVLISLLLATPIWAVVIYLIWFIIKETLPFV